MHRQITISISKVKNSNAKSYFKSFCSGIIIFAQIYIVIFDWSMHAIETNDYFLKKFFNIYMFEFAGINIATSNKYINILEKANKKSITQLQSITNTKAHVLCRMVYGLFIYNNWRYIDFNYFHA